jgi:hypothetical protein
MDEESRSESSEDRDYAEPEADLPASTLIGANITGANSGTYVGGVVGPASEVAEAEEPTEPAEATAATEARDALKKEDEGEDLGAINFDALGKFTSDQDQSASTEQSGSGANEPNG